MKYTKAKFWKWYFIGIPAAVIMLLTFVGMTSPTGTGESKTERTEINTVDIPLLLVEDQASAILVDDLGPVSYIDPVGFTNSKENQAKVIAFIKKQVKEDYSKIGMNDPATLRMMEQENLKAFKTLLTVEDKSLLRSTAKTYCKIGMCNYSTILMMYEEQENASKQELSW